jgi:hypothetical protein
MCDDIVFVLIRRKAAIEAVILSEIGEVDAVHHPDQLRTIDKKAIRGGEDGRFDGENVGRSLC